MKCFGLSRYFLFLWLGLFLLLFLYPNHHSKAKPPIIEGDLPEIERPIIIQPQSIDTNCLIAESPCINLGNQTKEVGNSWTQYGAVVLQPEEGSACPLNRIIFTVKIKINNTWQNASSTTPIKITSGANPQTRGGQTELWCNPNTTPRATWVLQVNTGKNCTTQNLTIEAKDVDNNYWTTDFNIIVDDGTCEQAIDYSPSLLVFSWILALWLAVKIVLLLKNNKRV